MNYSWDEAKRAANFVKRSVDFKAVYGFDWDSAIFRLDQRFDYGEERTVATGFIAGRLHVVVYVEGFERRRIISLRKANKREQRIYEQETENRAG
ncbi:MAG: BrnT family toxin [Rhodospirillales bacterium]